jgi:hypothetical protein
VNNTTRDLPPIRHHVHVAPTSKLVSAFNFLQRACTQSPQTRIPTSIWRWASHAAHSGTGIGRQVTQQVCRLSRGILVHLPFPVCSSEANIRSYPAWQLKYRQSHMIFSRLQNKGHGSTARCLQDSENSKISLSNIYKCQSLSSVLSRLTWVLGYRFFHRRCVPISLNSFLPLSQQLNVQLSFSCASRKEGSSLFKAMGQTRKTCIN